MSYINFVDPEFLRLHAKIQDHQTSGSGDEDFEGFKTYGHGIVLRRRDTKESTCLLWDITTENPGLCCYAVRITQNTYVKK